MALLHSRSILRTEANIIALVDRTFRKACQVRTLNYAKELPRRVRQQFSSQTFAVQLDKHITELIRLSLIYADRQMKKRSAARVNPSFILTEEAIRISKEFSQEAAQSIIRMLKDNAIYYEHPRELARRIEDLWGGEWYRAERFAQTFTADVATATTVRRFRQYGVRYMVFDAEKDDRTCDSCWALDGTVFDLEKESVDEYRPPLHQFCRCGLMPLTEGEVNTDMLFENRDFSKVIEDPEKLDEIFENIDRFNEKYRVSKYIIDQDLAARIMQKKGILVDVTGPPLENMLSTPIKETGVPVLETVIQTYEKKIKDKPYENCYLFADDGTLILSKSGTERAIRFDEEELMLFRGNVFTHNHPRSTSFSPADVRTSCIANLKEVRIASSKYSYSMKLKDGNNFSMDLWQDMIEPSMVKYDREVNTEFITAINNGKLDVETADTSHWHEVWKRVAKDITNLEYIRK